MGWICVGILFLIACLPAASAADACRLETPGASELVRGLVRPETQLVSYCWFCDEGATA